MRTVSKSATFYSVCLSLSLSLSVSLSLSLSLYLSIYLSLSISLRLSLSLSLTSRTSSTIHEALPRFLYCAGGTFGEREREREIQRGREGERERERETDGSDVTIVALKLAMNSHCPLPKIRTIGDELTLSLAKNSHFSFLPSHFPSLPSRRGLEVTIVALKFAMSSHFPLPKNVSPSLFPLFEVSLKSFKWH